MEGQVGGGKQRDEDGPGVQRYEADGSRQTAAAAGSFWR